MQNEPSNPNLKKTNKNSLPTGYRGPLYTHLLELEKISETQDPTIKNIFSVFGPDGHYVLILFLVIPFLQPIPLFGLSTVVGGIIVIVATLAYFNKPPWVPERWSQKTMNRKTILLISAGAEKILTKLKILVHPRLIFFYQGPFQFINFFFLVFNAVILALPLPIPFSNIVPAVPILLISFGKLEDDGLLTLLAYLYSVLYVFLVFWLTQGAILSLENLKLL
jgi:hypothetical protein